MCIRDRQSTDNTILTDITTIQEYWGQVSPYRDNAENYFGVEDVGLPDGCQVEQAHSLQRHAQRFPTSSFDDGLNDENFAAKVLNFTKANPAAKFTGPLVFLNTYEYQMGESYVCRDHLLAMAWQESDLDIRSSHPSGTHMCSGKPMGR